VLPRDLASDYRYIPDNLLERFFHPATDARLNRIALSEARPGSLLVPRVNGKPVLWGELIKLILDDSQLLKFETYGRPFDSTEMKPNEPCELLSGKQYVYKPVDLELFRKNIVSIQMNFLVNLWNLARFKLMLGLIWPCLMTLSYAPRYRNVRLCGGDKCGSLSPVYNL
jgi:hypothetical protein